MEFKERESEAEKILKGSLSEVPFGVILLNKVKSIGRARYSGKAYKCLNES